MTSKKKSVGSTSKTPALRPAKSSGTSTVPSTDPQESGAILGRLDDIQNQLQRISQPAQMLETASASGVESGEIGRLLKDELTAVAESLKNEFRSSVESLRQVQTSAATSQSEVLRTLTDLIFQSASGQMSLSDIEKLLFDSEARIKDHLSTIKVSVAAVRDETVASEIAEPKAVARSGPRAKSWEEMRQDLMRGASNDNEEIAVVEIEDEAHVDSSSPSTGSTQAFSLPAHDAPFEIPEAIDTSKLSDEQLREEFYKRELLISALSSRLRRQCGNQSDMLTVDQLRKMTDTQPEELAKAIRYTLMRMDEQLRLGELEMSLERARLSRQLTQLEHTKQILERNARQMGLTINPDGTISGTTGNQGKGSSSRRWLGKLGFRE
ncbi:MAG: hypothetical protein JNL58_06370 [Planctomyces sp.]|nr:hypothetical protein [Planctomyces sp.]